MVRVITGSAKGQQLDVPKHITRPLTDRIKTSIFDIITPYIINAHVLDLFAGSGAFAIEALSRGAKSATLLDINEKAIEVIKSNLRKTKLLKSATVIKQDAKKFANKSKSKFNIIFLDPPFPMDKKNTLLPPVAKLLSNNGLLILRTPIQEQAPKTVEFINSVLLKEYEKEYGVSRVTFYINDISD